MKIINKLLWKEKEKWQIAGAGTGLFLGLFLLLSAFQVYMDLGFLMNGGGTDREEYVIINKEVNLFNTLGAKSTFTREDIAELEGQPFIEGVGKFTPNLFKVSASSRMLGFYTELFFESVSDEFMDIEAGSWSWEKGQTELPIVLSRDYLALYNFGFAPSQGLPQFTPSTIKRVSMDINISGRGKKRVFQGRIVGFSDRINSILVPFGFMEWANQNFGESDEGGASRLILSTPNPYSGELSEFLDRKGYEVSSGRLIGGQVATLLNILITIMGGIGVVIFLLSFLVFLLNYQLSISRSSPDIRLLLQLGYKHGHISSILSRQLIILFSITFLITLLVLRTGRSGFVSWFGEQGFDLPPGIHEYIYVAALIIAGGFIGINILNIRQQVRALFR